jgi:hypothetical protein
MRSFSVVKSSSVISLTISACLGFLCAIDCAQAQQVNNGSFEIPVAGLPAPNNYISHPSADANNKWAFSGPTGPVMNADQSGVQQTGSVFTAHGAGPATPDGKQTGWLQGKGSISQSIDFPKSGAYELSFKMAWGTAGGPAADPITVSLDGNDTVIETKGVSKTLAQWRSDYQAAHKPPDSSVLKQIAAERQAKFDAEAKALQEQQDSDVAALKAKVDKEFEELTSQ